MRVLLVQPEDIAQNYIPKRPTLGIGYLAAVLEKDHEVRIFDARLRKERFENILKEFKPQLVGYTLTSLVLKQAKELMQKAKTMLPGVTNVIGGPEVTLLVEKMLSPEYVDFAVAGEGEHSFRELVSRLEKGKDYEDIKGLAYKRDGKIISNPHEYIQVLDKLPFPAWHLFSLKNYRKDPSKIKFAIMTSRGCPYHCSFCDSTKINGNYRVRSASNVVDELEFMHKRYGARSFQFMDDNFAIHRDRVAEICDEIIRRGLNITWVVGQGFLPSRGDYEIFKKMKDSGCIVVYFGIESADDEVLRNIRKPFTVEQARKAIKAAKKAGLIVKAPFISGLPGATYEKERKYIDFFRETGIDMPKMGQLIPFPGTDMYDWVKENAKLLVPIESIHTDFSQTKGALGTDLIRPAFETEDFPLKDRIKVYKEFTEESKKYILQKNFGRPLGYLLYMGSRIRLMRYLGVKMLDIYYEQF
ncbi:radical SAM protein [Candidatus Woesearchaeota archaeon]|nr:radical SAM protein [Candidatus Woesearchaeota archaeon]